MKEPATPLFKSGKERDQGVQGSKSLFREMSSNLWKIIFKYQKLFLYTSSFLFTPTYVQ